jgi:hypothetical protein
MDRVTTRGKVVQVNLPKTFNRASGKETTRPTDFSDATWGKATRDYAQAASKLPDVKFHAIVNGAKEFMKPVRGRKATQVTDAMDVDEDNARAMLVDHSDVESDNCMFLNVNSSLTDTVV